MNARVSSMSPRFAAVDPQQASIARRQDRSRSRNCAAAAVPFLPRVEHVSREQIAEHPHGLLLALAQHVLLGLQQRPVVRHGLGDTGYRADPEHFARQMDVFDRMRETERAARQGGVR